MADEPSSPQPPPGFGQSRYQLGPDDTPTVPNLFAQGDPPPGFWDAPRPRDDAARQDPARPGVAGSPAAASGAGAAAAAAGPGPGPQVVPPPEDAGLGVQVASTLPPPAERRRGALIAVGLVALATVLVVAAALLIGPHLGGGGTDDDNQQAAPPLTPASTSLTTSSDGGGASETSAAVAPPPVDPTEQSGAGESPDATAPSTGAGTTRSVVTVTVTAGSSTSGKGHAKVHTKGGKHAGRAASGSKKTTGTKSKHTSSTAPVSKSTHTATTTPTSRPSRYGVPIRQIGCSNGFIVQLASELTPKAFAARVAELQRQGLVPDDAKAANSAKSCKLFTNQTNTLILYAGPFQDRYDACSDRLAGPYDAFIRGANPGTSGEFVSCICPDRARDLPTISRVGATDQWIGELQRMLAAHLRYSIPDLGIDSWGTYTDGTRAAVQRFQSDNGLHGSGTVDTGTWRALQHAGC